MKILVRDLFAARPDEDPFQDGIFFDREAKMREIANRRGCASIEQFERLAIQITNFV